MAEEPLLLEPKIGEAPHFGVLLKAAPGGTDRAPNGFIVEIARREPLKQLRELVAKALDAPSEATYLVADGKELDPEQTLEGNGVTLPGPARRRKGDKVQLYFDLKWEVTEGERKALEEAAEQARQQELERLQEHEREYRAAFAAQQEAQDQAERDRKAAEEARVLEEQARMAEAAIAAGRQPDGAMRLGGGERLPEHLMPKLNWQRLVTDFKRCQRAMQDGTLPGLRRLQPGGPESDNLMCWNVDLSFREDSLLQQSLNQFAMTTLDETQNCVSMQVRFPPEYPQSPPEVWIERPRLNYRAGIQVTFAGRVCSPMLASANWQVTHQIVAMLQEIQQSLVDAGAEVNSTYAVRRPYAPPPVALNRLSTALFQTTNEFQMDMRVISGREAAGFLGDVTRLEMSDKIALPFDLVAQIYNRPPEELELPLLFEVRTELGRKTHMAISDFANGIPPGHCLLPTWVMNDMHIDERDQVRIRCVKLPLIESVKIMPHTAEFYEAVAESGAEVSSLLTQSLGCFSALTVETSVPIQIGDRSFNVEIEDLQPLGAVRLIDTDVVHHYEFRVDFDAAPDLEDEETKRAWRQQLVENMGAKERKQEEERQKLEQKRAQAKRQSFERLRAAAVAAAGPHDGTEGEIEVSLKLPGGEARGRFQDGAPVMALLALALKSEWAEAVSPWALSFMQAFPRKELVETDVITKDMHRNRIVAQEQDTPDNDEELFADPGVTLTRNLSVNQRNGQRPGGEFQLPELDEERLRRETERFFELQRFIQAGHSPEEALRRFDNNERQQPGERAIRAEAQRPPVAAPEPAPAPRAPAAPAPAPAGQDDELADFDTAPPVPGEDHYESILQVMGITQCNAGGARRMLQVHNGDVMNAVNALLDEHFR